MGGRLILFALIEAFLKQKYELMDNLLYLSLLLKANLQPWIGFKKNNKFWIKVLKTEYVQLLTKH